VLAHLQAENEHAQAVLAPLAELEAELFQELSARLPERDDSVPVLHHGHWYQSRYETGAEHPRYLRRPDVAGAPEEVLLDADALARAHDYFEVGDLEVSPDGRWLAYTADLTGRRQYQLFLRALPDGLPQDEGVANIEAEFVWSGDSAQLLVVEKDPVTLLSCRVRAHRLGTPAHADRLVYEEADDSYYLSIGLSRSERFIWIACSATDQSEWHAIDRDDPALAPACICTRRAGLEYQVEHLDQDWILLNNWQAPDFRVSRAPIGNSGDPTGWLDIVPPRSGVLIEDFEVCRSHLALNERKGGYLGVCLHAWDGSQAIEVAALDGETACTLQLDSTPELDSPRLRLMQSSLVRPATTFEIPLAGGPPEVLKVQAVNGYQPGAYRSWRAWARAPDGARVPFTLACRRDTPLDGSSPAYLHGYGAYGLSMDPEFRASWVSLMDRGLVLAIAHVRGGQELGRNWFEQGRLAAKANSFHDFIAVTDALGAGGLADPACIMAQGGSAGGLLIGAVANLAPERYRAMVAHVPFVDVLTTMLDESLPLTTNEYEQWGDPRLAADYARMLSYSPYDNVRAADYPALLVFSGLWDSQVQYFEPAKWVARLRERKTDQRPLLLCMDLSAGHGGRSGRYERYREVAREFAFVLWQAGRAHGTPAGPIPGAPSSEGTSS
jgi:oligopeptidase B